MRTVQLFLFLIFLGVTFQSLSQLYTYKNYSHREGLNMVTTLSLEQSEDGYIWIGTAGSPLIRFDGETFKEIRIKEQDSEHHITDLSYNRDTVFFASQYKGFYAYVKKSNKYVQLESDRSATGDAFGIVVTDDYKYFISNRRIQSYRNGVTKDLLRSDKSDIVLNYYVVNDNNAIIFTKEGNFFLSDGNLTQLHELLNLPKSEVDQYSFGHIFRDNWILCNDKGTKWLKLGLNSNKKLVVQNASSSEGQLSENEVIVSYDFRKSLNKVVAVTNLGNLYQVNENRLQFIPHNFNGEIEQPLDILVDLNGDYWLSTDHSGMYKVSLEPFTKIQLHPLYSSPRIIFPYQTVYNDIFISLMGGITKVGGFGSEDFQEFPFIIHGVTRTENTYYCATNKGVKRFEKSESSVDFIDVFFKNKNINFILGEREYLWIGVAGEGLYRVHLKSRKPVKIESLRGDAPPNYVYTGQLLDNQKSLYIGTSNGIYFCKKDNPKLQRLQTPKSFGSYSGCSTKDVYGTIWFTMEKGLVGVRADGEMVTITGDDYFTTNLFFTLCSDRLGNLIVGTNKGINILKVDKNGLVKTASSYDANSGFGGYETHMRSQFQNDNSIFVGTVEGLFLINTDILEQLKTPIRPTIIPLSEFELSETDSKNVFQFKFKVNNPKSGNIDYIYRLLGSDDEEWHLVSQDQLNLFNLNSGDYTLEVKATHDSRTFSPKATYKFSVPGKFWESSWIIFGVIGLIISLNFLLIRYSGKLDAGSLIQTKDMEVHIRMAPLIILLGIFIVSSAHIVGPLINSELELNLPPVLFLTFCLIGLYFLSRSVINTDKEYLLNRMLIFGVILILTHLFYESYRSNLHPFHLIGIVLTCLIVPFFLHGVRSMVYFSSFILLNVVVLLLLVESPVYPKSYAAIAYAALILLLIFSSFLRANSLERLIFISGIINKGNIPAIAFNSNGKIIYVSENISNFINSTHEDLINEDISSLNHFIPYEGKYKNVDVVKEFVDGNNYVVPLADGDGVIHWIDWQYKEFSDDIKVMLGQEVSEKMELQNTYELLVQNAEDFIYRCDINGNFIFLNETCYQRLGYSKEDLINVNSMSIVPDDFRDEVEKYYREHFENKKRTSYKEFPILKKDGEIVWIGQHVTTIFAPGSNSYINGFIALARDITDLKRQQQLIKDQRDSITSSINYAQKIQINLLPHERYFAAGFREHFIIYKPKDIVSGDFYWLETIGETTVVALADCTGHGVPGSFMTLLGINLLNSIVKENRVIDPGKILDELDKRLVDILPRNENQNSLNDGMEITICAIDQSSDDLAYACAGSRFLIYSEDTFTMFKGDNKHIGDHPPKDFQTYSTHYTRLTSDDYLYLFTDGVQDQFGGTNDKKFTFRRVLTMLENNVDSPLPDQRKIIEKKLNNWIGKSEQTDDITLMAIKKKLI